MATEAEKIIASMPSMAAHFVHCAFPTFAAERGDDRDFSIHWEDDVIPDGWRLNFADGSRLEFVNKTNEI